MGITSLGIFGFLTGAYQVHSTKVGAFSTQIAALTSEKAAIDTEILEYSSRIKTLTEVRAAQEQRVVTAGNYKAPRDQAYKAIAEANEEIQKKEYEISQDRQKGVTIDKELAALNISMNTTTDIGSFKFIADALNTSVDTAVQYFIFLLIFVFDPLAVTLVLAWNNLLAYRKVLKIQEDEAFLAELNRSIVDDSVVITPPQVIPQIVHNEPAVTVTPQVTPEVTPQVEKLIEFSLPLAKVEASPVVAPVTAAVRPPINFGTDLENDPRFLKLSEEQKNIERARRRVVTGHNDSVITT
jgi:hypothetical protein